MQSLVADLLLYDRLVFPVFPGEGGENALARGKLGS
jgi:hypothetical protein